MGKHWYGIVYKWYGIVIKCFLYLKKTFFVNSPVGRAGIIVPILDIKAQKGHIMSMWQRLYPNRSP